MSHAPTDHDAIGLPFGESPVDIAAPEDDLIDPASGEDAPRPRPALGWAMAVLVMANALLLVCNTHALTNWANQQAATPLNAPLLGTIQQWQDMVSQTGLDRPVAWGQAQWRALRAQGWPGQPATPVQD
ncbi:MAG TPA: hypothetical protein VN222_07330 [Novosphingobium sp.]|nr:hypothetical protein [Novosphingobium sp.]